MQITLESLLHKSVKTIDVADDAKFVFLDGELFEKVGQNFLSQGACHTPMTNVRATRPTFREQHAKMHGLPTFSEPVEAVVVDSSIEE